MPQRVSVEEQNRNSMIYNFTTFIFKSHAISFSKLQSKTKQDGTTIAETFMPPVFNSLQLPMVQIPNPCPVNQAQMPYNQQEWEVNYVWMKVSKKKSMKQMKKNVSQCAITSLTLAQASREEILIQLKLQSFSGNKTQRLHLLSTLWS